VDEDDVEDRTEVEVEEIGPGGDEELERITKVTGATVFASVVEVVVLEEELGDADPDCIAELGTVKEEEEEEEEAGVVEVREDKEGEKVGPVVGKIKGIACSRAVK